MRIMLALLLVLAFATTAVADHWVGHQRQCVTRCTRNSDGTQTCWTTCN